MVMWLTKQRRAITTRVPNRETIYFRKLVFFVPTMRSPIPFLHSKLKITISLISVKLSYGPWITRITPLPTIVINWTWHLYCSRAEKKSDRHIYKTLYKISKNGNTLHVKHLLVEVYNLGALCIYCIYDNDVVRKDWWVLLRWLLLDPSGCFWIGGESPNRMAYK